MIFLYCDDKKTAVSIDQFLQKKYKLKGFNKKDSLFLELKNNPPKLLILDHDFAGLDIYKEISQLDPNLPIILISSSRDISLAVRVTKLGAADFIAKPLDKNKFLSSVKGVLRGKGELSFLKGISNINWLQGSSVLCSSLLQEIEGAIDSFLDVLVLGEVGVDKRAIGELISQNSPVKGVFKVFNLASYGRDEEESFFWTTLRGMLLLSGQEKKEIKINTLYLKGFEQLNPHFRESLLQFLINRRRNVEFDRSIRIIMEVTHSINELNDFTTISIPSARFRREDLPVIVASYISQFSTKFTKPIKGIGTDLIPFFAFYDFPGNFKELEEILAAAVLRCRGEYLCLSDLPLTIKMLKSVKSNQLLAKNNFNLIGIRQEFEKTFFKFVLDNCNNDISQAARFLDIPKSVFEDRLSLLGLNP